MPQEYHELPEQVQQNVLTCLKIHREQLTNALLKEHCKRKLLTVTDFDWRLKVLSNTSSSFLALINVLSSIVGDGIKQNGFFAGIPFSVRSHSRGH